MYAVSFNIFIFVPIIAIADIESENSQVGLFMST